MAALSLGALGSPAASPLPAPSSLGNPSLTSRSRASSHRAVGVGIDNVEFGPALLIHRSFLEQHDRPLGPIPIPGCLGSSGSAWGLPSYRHLCCRRLINVSRLHPSIGPEFRLSLCRTAPSLALEFVGVSPGCLQPTQLASRMRAAVCFISHLKTVRISTCHCWRRAIACFPFPAQTSRPRGGKTVARTRSSSAYPQSRHMLCDPVLQWFAGGKGGKRVVNHATTTHFILPDLCLAFLTSVTLSH